MSEFIGLRSHLIDNWLYALGEFSYAQNSARLKQQVLFFDRIGITSLSEPPLSNNQSLNTSEFLQWQNELSWLKENKVVYEARLKDIDVESINDISVFQLLLPQFKFFLPQLGNSLSAMADSSIAFIDVVKNLGKKGKGAADEILFGSATRSLIQSETLILRLLSQALTTSTENNFMPLLSFADYSYETPSTIKNDVAEIVINKLPIPSETTPWEAILDYRNDPDTQKNLRALRRWVRKLSSENISPVEISDELETLIDEYQNHMKLHKMKANTETLEVILKIPFEILENLLKIKFSKIPEPFFAIKKRQISLMEAEMNAPGREIAYILKTNEKFSNS
jgi:hypothetical protein